jgi:hypothetical protein
MQENTPFLLQKSARMGPSFKVSMRHNFQADVLTLLRGDRRSIDESPQPQAVVEVACR